MGWFAQLLSGTLAGMVAVVGACWLLAAFVFGLIRKELGATEGGINGLAAVVVQLGLLRSDAQLRRLIVTRTLLPSTALAPPFYIALSGDRAASGLGTLGSFMIAHQGVRLGRSVHVVDMAERDNRATYTALSNSVVGLILLAGGVFGVIAQWLGIGAVLAIFTSMAALGIFAAAGLDDVQAA